MKKKRVPNTEDLSFEKKYNKKLKTIRKKNTSFSLPILLVYFNRKKKLYCTRRLIIEISSIIHSFFFYEFISFVLLC